MKLRVIGATLLIIICMLLSGCGALGRFPPVESLRLVEVLSYDAPTRLGAAAEATEEAPALGLSAAAWSIPAAAEALAERSDRGSLLLAHTGFVLLGPEAAEAGIGPLLDWAERDSLLRLDAELLLLDVPAAELMDRVGEDFDLVAAVRSVRDEARAGADGPIPDLRETALALSERGSAAVLLLHCSLPEDGPPELTPGGCGILKDGRLCGTLDRKQSQLLALLLGCGGSPLRELPEAVLRLQAKGGLRPQEAGRAELAFTAEAAVVQAGTTTDAETLSAALESELRLELAELMEALRAMDADVLGLRRAWERRGLTDLPADWLAAVDFSYAVRVLADRGADWDRPVPLNGGAA